MESENEEGLSRRITWTHKDGIRKNKDWLQSKMEMDIKCNTKATYNYISSKMIKENANLTLALEWVR